MKWIFKTFNELTVEEFHAILKLRIDIFVVEQNCPYPELDGKDQLAYHYYGVNDANKIIAYSRFFKAGDYYQEAAFGRVAVDKKYRNQKLGKELIKNTIDKMEELFGKSSIKIGGQQYLQKFYESFGFQIIGEPYIEDGIPHYYMILKR